MQKAIGQFGNLVRGSPSIRDCLRAGQKIFVFCSLFHTYVSVAADRLVFASIVSNDPVRVRSFAMRAGVRAGSVADRKITVLLIHTKTCGEKIGWIVDFIGDGSDAVTVSVAGGTVSPRKRRWSGGRRWCLRWRPPNAQEISMLGV
jgi:hypothetical protein